MMISFIKQKVRRSILMLLAGTVMLGAVTLTWWAGSVPTQAATVNDAYISAVTMTTSSTTPGAVANYTYSFTTSATIAAGSELYFNIESVSGCQDNDYTNCVVNLSASTFSGISGSEANRQSNSITWQLNSDLPAGTHVVTISNAVNPVSATVLRGSVNTTASDESALLGADFSVDNWYTTLSSNPLNIGTVVVSGTVTAGGQPATGIRVDVHNTDWSVSKGTNTDEKGYYAIFLDYESSTYWANNSYTAAAYPNEGSGYINTQQNFTYSGTAVSNDMSLSAAEYFFAGTITYDDTQSATVAAEAGDPVTNATICFNATNGAGNYCDATDSNGQYSVAVKAGSYNAYISANVNWENPAEVAAVDWRYSGTDDTYSISERGTQTTNFAVQATTALVSGALTIPNSTDLVDGSIGFTNESSNYWGPVTDNTYALNLNPGKYEVWFYPDTNQNAAWGKYSYNAVTTLVAGSNTYNLSVEELTGRVTATVQTADGAPVSDIQVQAWSEKHWTNAQTNEVGQVTLYIAAGEWYQVGVWDETYLLDGNYEKVNVSDGGSAEVNFTVQLPDATIIATIMQSDGTVPDELHGWFGCETKDYQRHYGEDLRNGTVEVGVVVDDDTGLFEGSCHLWLPDQSAGVAAPQDVTVARDTTADLTFTLQALDATVKTSVKNFATGQKIEADPSLNVTLWNDSDKLWHNTQLETNPVLVPVISNKTYTGGIWSQSSDYISLWSMNSATVKVPAGGTGTLVLNVLKKDGTMVVNVKDPNGDPVAHGWAWCGNWEEVNFALDTAASNTVIDSGAEIRDGVAEVPLVSGHSYRCGVGAPEEFVEQGWLSPKEQAVKYKSKKDTLPDLEFKFKESDATLQGQVKIQENKTKAVRNVADADSVWCWAWSEGGSSWSDTEPGENYRLNLDTSHDQWSAGCDAVIDDTWYFTEEPYEFSPKKGKNVHDFTLQPMGTWKIYEPINETFDAGENKVITYGDGTRLTIPAGTLATSGNVTVRGTPETNIIRTDDHPLTIPIDWEAFDENDNLIETFPGGEVTIEVPYTDEALEELGVNEDSLVGKYWDELSGSWKSPDNVTIDKKNNVITVTTSHFTQYGVTYNARVGEVDKPNAPTVNIRSVNKYTAKLLVRTKKGSARVTRFVVEVRKVGVKNKAHWKTTIIKNPKEKIQLVRTIQKLKSHTNYQLRVKACIKASCSDPTDWKDFTTK